VTLTDIRGLEQYKR